MSRSGVHKRCGKLHWSVAKGREGAATAAQFVQRRRIDAEEENCWRNHKKEARKEHTALVQSKKSSLSAALFVTK
jgi:hypothetical protein